MNRWTNAGRALPLCAGLAMLGAGMSQPVRGAETVDACKLLTQAQVSAALGIAVDAGVRPIVTEPRMCNWRESNKPSGPGRNVMLTLIEEKEFEKMKTLPMSTPAKDVGDDAVVTRSMHVPAMLAVKAGTHYFQILVRSDLVASEEADTRNQEVERALASKIIKRLG